MKTITEFSAFDLRRAHGIKMNLIRDKQAETEKAAAQTAPAESAPTDAPAGETPAVESPAPEASAPETPSLDVETERRARVAARREQLQAIENAVQEQLSSQLATELKLEGERLNHFLNAMNVVDSRRARDLRRVIVFTLDENERVPADSKKIGEHFYKSEYMAPLHDGRGRRDRRGGRGGRGSKEGRGGKRFGKGRGDGRGEGRGPRRDRGRGPRPQGQGSGPSAPGRQS